MQHGNFIDSSRYRTLNFLHLSVTSTASIKHRAIARYNMKINTISAVKRITIIITYYMILMKFHARGGISRFRCEKIHSRTLSRNFVGKSAGQNHGSYLARARALPGRDRIRWVKSARRSALLRFRGNSAEIPPPPRSGDRK